jgi:Sulfotransferase domain
VPDMHQHGDVWEGLSMRKGMGAPYNILKTHWVWDRYRKPSAYIFRRPEDSLCSYFHFHLRFDHMRAKTVQGIDAFCREFVSEWCEHTQSFISAKRGNPLAIHFTSYETLHEEPVYGLGGILRFLGIEAARSEIEKAVDNHAFEKQKQIEVVPINAEGFFRKGKTDSAKEELQPETLRFIRDRADALYIVAQNMEESQNLELA